MYVLEFKMKGSEDVDRCEWCLINEKMIKYHDEEWGVPVHDDRKHFEFLMLEVLQCGLNWNMMIQKREVFCQCFDNFDYEIISKYDESDILRILETDGMIKSRRKVDAIIHNSRSFIDIINEFGSFSKYIWKYCDGKTILYDGHETGKVPSRNGLSDTICKDLKKRGIKFIGSITIYSHLQASGIINDHSENCFRYKFITENYPTAKLKIDNES